MQIQLTRKIDILVIHESLPRTIILRQLIESYNPRHIRNGPRPSFRL